MRYRTECWLIVALCGLCTVSSSRARAQAQERFALPAVRGLDEFLPVPEDNPLSREKIVLGSRLFFDPSLSRDRSIACVSCHQARFAFGDTVRISSGAFGRIGRRNTPAIVNRAYGATFFWDGRAASLEEQVLQPIADSLEMDLPLDDLLARLLDDSTYAAAFRATFADGLNLANIARSLASFVRTLRSGDSPFDRYVSGDTTALPLAAQRGLELFRGKARCVTCHVGPNFTDEQFHNTGVAAGTSDVGRYAVTRGEADRGGFKTPTLREVANTAPYMHDGRLRTLEEVLDFYDRGGRQNAGLDREILPLGLSGAEKRDLIEFLRALSGSSRAEVDDLPERSGS